MKNYYAVAQGYIAPAICTSWGIAAPLVTGYSKNEHQAFKTLKEAVSYIGERGHRNYYYFEGAGGERAPRNGKRAFYAVANGRTVGVYEFYREGAEIEIKGYSHSCHQAFETREEAENFIEEFRSTKERLKHKPGVKIL